MNEIYIEVTRKPAKYNPEYSNVENTEFNRLFSCSRAEFDSLKKDICRSISALKLDRQIQVEDLIDVFLIHGYIDDDVLTMFEEMICTLTNDDVDKVDYRIWSVLDW